MSGGEVGLLDIRSQGVGVRQDREKRIRVGYASGRYDAVERGRMVTSVGMSAIQGRPDFASNSEGGGLFQADQSILGGGLSNWRRMRGRRMTRAFGHCWPTSGVLDTNLRKRIHISSNNAVLSTQLWISPQSSFLVLHHQTSDPLG